MTNNNTQLPKEVVEEIKQKAEDFGYVPEREQVNALFNPDYETGYIAGATAYATKLHEVQQELHELKQQNKHLKEALNDLTEVLPKGESLKSYHARDQLIYARGILVLFNDKK